MNTPNPVIYEFCRNAWENYRHDEDLSTQSLPALVPEYVELGVAGRLLQALRALLAPRKPAARSTRQHGMQRSAAR